MAGSEQVGLDGADPDLFVGATWVLTPTVETDLDAFSRLAGGRERARRRRRRALARPTTTGWWRSSPTSPTWSRRP